MKLKVYTSGQKERLLFLIIAVLVCLALGIIVITEAEPGLTVLILFIAFFYVLLLIGSLFYALRYPHHVIVDEDAMRSYNVFGKLLCTVDLTRCVYYAHYDYYTKGKYGPYKFEARYCMLSNQIFLRRHEVGKKLPEPSEYDAKKVLVIRINETSEPYLRYEDWVQLDG